MYFESVKYTKFFNHNFLNTKDVGTFDVKYFNQLIVDDLYTEAQSQVIRWFVTLMGILFRCCLTLICVINCEESRWTAVYQVHVNNLLGYINVRTLYLTTNIVSNSSTQETKYLIYTQHKEHFWRCQIVYIKRC